MNEQNTPGIYPVLQNTAIDYIPEAHCYLQIKGIKLDFTHQDANLDMIINDIIITEEIEADQIFEYKVAFHKNFLNQWLLAQDINLSFEQIWNIREACILQLSK